MSEPRKDRLPRQHPERRAHRRRRARRVGLWSLASMTVVAVLLGVGILVLVGQTLTAPDWLRARIADRIERNLGGLQLSFGDVELVVNRGWRPRARLRDVELTDAAGQPIVQLADAEASLAMRPLLRGQVQPKTIALNGAHVTVRRDKSGAVALFVGPQGRQVDQARSVADLVDRIDRIFSAPALSALVRVDLQALTVRYEDMVSGRALTVDGGDVRLDRKADDLRIAGLFSLLSGRAQAAVLDINYASRLGDSAAEFGLTVTDIHTRDLAGFGPALAWLDVLRAPVSGSLRGSVNAAGKLGPLNATLQIGEGALQPNDTTRPVPFRSARTYFRFVPATQVLTFDEVSLVSDWVTASAEGQAYLGGIADGRLDELIGQARVTGMELNPRGLYPQAVLLSNAAVDFRLRLDPFDLTLGQMQVEDAGTTFRLAGRLRAEAEGWDVAVDGSVDRLSPDRLVELWPAAAVPNTRTWLAENLSGGELSDANFALRVHPGRAPDVYLDFDYADTTVRFAPTMPPIDGATGQATLVGNRFVTTATRGVVMAEQGGGIDVAGTSFIIPDVSSRGETPAVARIVGRSSVTAALSLLNRPPLSVLSGPGWPETMAEGALAFEGTLSLPLKAQILTEEIEFHAKGTARDVSTGVIVPGHVLTARELSIRATQNEVSVGGSARLDQVAVQALWTQPLGVRGAPGRVTGTAELSPVLVDTFRIGLPPGAVTGRGEAQFTIDLVPGSAPVLDAQSDLVGVGLSVPELGWSKPPAAGGELVAAVTLGAPVRVDRLDLQTAGLSATGSVTVRPDGTLDQVRITRIRVGDWLDAEGALVGRGSGQTPALRLGSGKLDLRRATFGSGGTEGGTPPLGSDALVVALDELRITDSIALTGFRGQFALTGGMDGRFTGAINGGAAVEGRVVPQDGRSAIRLVAADAGAVVRDAGILKQAHGGDFSLTLRPVGEPGNFEGQVEVTNTRVNDAPAIAALLNAVSVVGLLDELSGQGILFTDVFGRFTLSPSRITLHESSAVGASMGLSMDGIYDVPGRRLDMQGVISPVYLLNGIGSILSRRGEGLIGFNYRLTGSADAPDVQVNPLSALAPGMLRDLFRAAPPTASTSGEPLPERPRAAPRPAGESGR